jgi:aspartyl-tRNA(Asn)/glutamyl-tRNA(Gln) amidotransferase subunit C
LKIDKNTTLKIAKLSRIKINESEINELSSQLSSIVDWVEQLNEVNTDNVEPLSNVSMAKLPLRKDIENLKDYSEEVLSNAPDKLEKYFAVPKVVE